MWRISVALVGTALCCTASLAPAAARSAHSVWDGVYSVAQAARGEKLFARSCGGCHRDDASGGDDSEPPLRGPNFTPKWEGKPIAALYDFIATNMPRSRPGSIPLSECLDIVAFLLQLNDVPPGSTDLPTDIAVLSDIMFTAANPSR